MKTAAEFYADWNEIKEPAEAMIRRVQMDALEGAVKACMTVESANDEEYEDEGDREALGAADGARDCIVLIRKLMGW